jgi:hypothetical protein
MNDEMGNWQVFWLDDTSEPLPIAPLRHSGFLVQKPE